MAIKMDIDTGFGVTATYHRITVAEIDYVRSSARVFLAPYIDAEARQAGSFPLPVGEWHDISFEGEPTRGALYGALMPMLGGAVSV